MQPSLPSAAPSHARQTPYILVVAQNNLALGRLPSRLPDVASECIFLCCVAVQVNLVATQLVLDREHPNRLVFSPSRGLDPLLDLRLRGAQVIHPACFTSPCSPRNSRPFSTAHTPSSSYS